MKAIKIKIEKELIETDLPYLHEAILHGLTVVGEKEDYLTSSVSMGERITYVPMKISHPETKEIITYYVNTDDRKLWNDLIKVSDGFINDKIHKGVQEFKDSFLIYDLPRLEQNIAKTTKLQIKNLPWWKRLFKQF